MMRQDIPKFAATLVVATCVATAARAQAPRPVVVQPAQPGVVQPAQPGVVQPAQPGVVIRPGQPVIVQPGQPIPGQPGQPIPGQPGQPAAVRPGQPIPVQPGQPIPVQPGQPIPGQPGQPIPGQPGQPAMTGGFSDALFARAAGAGGLAEVATSQLAESRSQNEEIRKFAQQMIADHTQVNQQLAQLAASRGIGLGQALDIKDQATAGALAALPAEAFDREYVRNQVAAHIMAVSLFEAEAQLGADPQFKAFAGQTVPRLRQHLQMARGLMGRAGGGPNAESGAPQPAAPPSDTTQPAAPPPAAPQPAPPPPAANEDQNATPKPPAPAAAPAERSGETKDAGASKNDQEGGDQKKDESKF